MTQRYVKDALRDLQEMVHHASLEKVHRFVHIQERGLTDKGALK
jgi:hypothetical protein